MPAQQDTSFARLVSLGGHDLRTPLATIYGFARTLERAGGLDEPQARYVEMIAAAAGEMTSLLELLSLAARIEGGRYQPVLAEVDTLALAQRVLPGADGKGTTIETDAPAAERALASFVSCAMRHGPVDAVALRVEGRELVLSPVTAACAPVILAREEKDLGAAVALRVVRALGGEVELDDDALRIRLS